MGDIYNSGIDFFDGGYDNDELELEFIYEGDADNEDETLEKDREDITEMGNSLKNMIGSYQNKTDDPYTDTDDDSSSEENESVEGSADNGSSEYTIFTESPIPSDYSIF